MEQLKIQMQQWLHEAEEFIHQTPPVQLYTALGVVLFTLFFLFISKIFKFPFNFSPYFFVEFSHWRVSVSNVSFLWISPFWVWLRKSKVSSFSIGTCFRFSFLCLLWSCWKKIGWLQNFDYITELVYLSQTTKTKLSSFSQWHLNPKLVGISLWIFCIHWGIIIICLSFASHQPTALSLLLLINCCFDSWFRTWF